MFHLLQSIHDLPDAQALEVLRKLRLESEAWMIECDAIANLRHPPRGAA